MIEHETQQLTWGETRLTQLQRALKMDAGIGIILTEANIAERGHPQDWINAVLTARLLARRTIFSTQIDIQLSGEKLPILYTTMLISLKRVFDATGLMIPAVCPDENEFKELTTYITNLRGDEYERLYIKEE